MALLYSVFITCCRLILHVLCTEQLALSDTYSHLAQLISDSLLIKLVLTNILCFRFIFISPDKYIPELETLMKNRNDFVTWTGPSMCFLKLFKLPGSVVEFADSFLLIGNPRAHRPYWRHWISINRGPSYSQVYWLQ